MYDENYANLANAIIVMAVEDYKKAKMSNPKSKNQKIEKEKTINDVTGFFKSQYFQALTGVPGECILKELEK